MFDEWLEGKQLNIRYLWPTLPGVPRRGERKSAFISRFLQDLRCVLRCVDTNALAGVVPAPLHYGHPFRINTFVTCRGLVKM